MLFNSFPFLFGFLPLVAAAYFAVPRHRLRLLLVVAASYYFYAYADWWFPALMAGSTAIGYVGGRLLEAEAPAHRRKVVLGLGIFGVLAVLGYFKYAAFTGGYGLDFVHAITQRSFPGVRSFVNSIVLPIGISFYTFEGISYQVDVYRGTLRAERDLLRYAFFISFFPHLIAGPIVRYGILQPQLLEKHRFDADRVRSGLLLFTLGLAKKVLLADGLARYVDHYLATPAQLGLVSSWGAAIGFGFQIYFDFSAYSDMALGLARVFGIELPWNFDRPYRAHNPREFWQRWNVTLSSWLRDYVYIPLGGNRRGDLRRDGNLLATMGIGGLWHGASFTFLAWGLWHGMLLVGHRRLSKLGLRVPGPVAVATTFFLVMIATIFFRMKDAHGIAEVLLSMAGAHGIGSLPRDLVPFLLLAGGLTFLVPEEWRWSFQRFGVWRTAAVGLVAGLAIVLVNETQRFIYFKF